MSDLDIACAWDTVNCGPKIEYAYPHAVTKYIEEHYSKAAVYRWGFFKARRNSDPEITQSPHAAYIGETENLARRLRGYLHPGPSQTTNKRLKAYLDEQLTLGTRIVLSILRFQAFHIIIDREKSDARLVAEFGLGNPHIRKMMENLAVIVHDPVHCEILNKSLNPIERRLERAEKALRDSTLEQRLAAIEKPQPGGDEP
jgi:hypothetical protein